MLDSVYSVFFVGKACRVKYKINYFAASALLAPKEH